MKATRTERGEVAQPGRARTIGNRVYPTRVSRVRIPPSPPIPETLDISRVSGFFFCLDSRRRKKNQSARFCANRVLRMVEYFWRDSNGNAKEAGLYQGRQKMKIDRERFEAVVREWRADKITAVEAMKQLDLKPNTFYRRVKEWGL